MTRKRGLIPQNFTVFSLQLLFLSLFIFLLSVELGIPDKRSSESFSDSFYMFKIRQDWIANVLSKDSDNLIVAFDQ
jgi:hypothetical protein